MGEIRCLPLEEETEKYLGDLIRQHEVEPEGVLDLQWERLRQLLQQPWSSVVVINTLLCRVGDAELKLDLPGDDAAGELALEAGLPFALANRTGQVDVDAFEGAKALLCSPAWRRTWTPATRPAWVALLGESPDELLPAPVGNGNGHHNGNGHTNGASSIEQLFSANRAVFVNPHRSGRSGSSESLFPLVGCWLSSIIAKSSSGEAGKSWRKRLLSGLDRVFDELIQNIRGHATSREGAAVFSLVKVQVDEEQKILRIAIQDTGPGIFGTLKPKLEEFDPVPEADLLRRLLCDELAPLGRARGVGLPKVWQTCRDLGAELTVASGLGRLRSPLGDDQLVSWLGDFEAPGVAIALTLPLLPAD